MKRVLMCICLLRIADAIEGAGGEVLQQEVSNDVPTASVQEASELVAAAEPTSTEQVTDQPAEAPKEETLLEKVEEVLEEMVEEVKEFFEGEDKSDSELDAPAE